MEQSRFKEEHKVTLPAILFGFIVSLFAGAVFHLLTGGGGAKLVVYMILSATGFWLGHVAGVQFNINILSVGPLRFGMAMLGCLMLLGLGFWLGQARTTSRSEKR